MKFDPALLRPGRLDKHVEIPLPDAKGREGILRWHLRDDLGTDDISPVAAQTDGASGASLEQFVRSARRLARRGRRDMRLGDLLEQLPPRVPMPPEIIMRTSTHEAGHAVVGLALGHWSIREAWIAQTYTDGGNQPAGLVHFSEGGYLRSRDYYVGRAIRSLAGAAAEDAILGNRTDGAGGVDGSDLWIATVTIAMMEAAYGLGDSFVHLSHLDEDRLMTAVRTNPELQRRVDAVLRECYDEARKIVALHKGDIERLAAALRERGRLSGAEVDEVLATSVLKLSA